MQYNNDNDEAMPGAACGAGGNGQIGGWIYYTGFTSAAPGTQFDPTRGSLYSFVKSTGVYVCPSDSAGQKDSYAINALTIQGGCVNIGQGIGLNAIQEPAGTILFNEENDGYQQGSDDGIAVTPANVPSPRHIGGSNFALCDGHAKWYRPEQVSTGATGVPRYQP